VKQSNLNLTNNLIKAGGGINIQDNYGSTPLHFGNSLEKLGFLMKHN
jgi:hypothetical protein